MKVEEDGDTIIITISREEYENRSAQLAINAAANEVEKYRHATLHTTSEITLEDVYERELASDRVYT